MKIFFTIGLISLTLILAAPRSKHTAYDLPPTAELLVGDIRTTFVCRKNGYYADQDNFCKIFHVCDTFFHPDGTPELVQWSFICGNNTIFNQFSLTCSYPEDAIPCGRANDFWNLNANIGVSPNVPFHIEQDVVRAVAVTESSTAHPLKPKRIPQFPRASFPMTTLRQPTIRTRISKASLVVADRSVPSRVSVHHPTTRSPFVQPPLKIRTRPQLSPLAVKEWNKGAVINSVRLVKRRITPTRPPAPSNEEILIILND